MNKVVVLLSGGMDSTTLLYHHVKGGDEVRAISFNYGQRHNKELDRATQSARLLNVPHEEVDLSDLSYILPGSSQTDMTVAVPEGHYSEETMKATVVPNRNMILLAIAIGHAIAYKMDRVSYAAHAGDHAIYPDCRPEFADKMAELAAICDWRKIELLRPFIKATKADIVRMGMGQLGVDYSKTWSCYQGKDIHCGRCGTCVERILAFKEAGYVDPVPYKDTEFAFKADERFKSGGKQNE